MGWKFRQAGVVSRTPTLGMFLKVINGLSGAAVVAMYLL